MSKRQPLQLATFRPFPEVAISLRVTAIERFFDQPVQKSVTRSAAIGSSKGKDHGEQSMANAALSRPGPSSSLGRVRGRDELLGDEELLELYLNGDEFDADDAFRMLVSRHGPMVLGVCRHVLNQDHDAEDAYQAVFLVLARKAGSIRDRRVLSSWLYEVAYRIAIKARAEAVRRRSEERQVVDPPMEPNAGEPIDTAAWNELRPVLHDEINRLPEKYRTPVILCYLEGKTNEEVSQVLNWPVGTVKGRLSRARGLLRSRLERRGLVLSAAFLAAMISKETVFAESLPFRLVESAARAGRTARRSRSLGHAKPAVPSDVSPGVPEIPPRVLALCEAYLRAGNVPRWFGIVLLLGVAIGSSGYGITSFMIHEGLTIRVLKLHLQRMMGASSFCHAPSVSISRPKL